MDLAQAMKELTASAYTCILFKGDAVFTSRQRGVAPLLQFLDSKLDLQGFSAADKVVGRATAFLYRALGVSYVYGQVMSAPAAAVLKAGGIDYSYELLVPGIRNRENTGPCPMEEATAGIQNPKEAISAIRAKRKALQTP